MSGVPSTDAVRAVGLEKSFGHWPVLWDLDLAVGWGEFLVLFGANAVGKTTLLRILSTQAKADGGALSVGGFDSRRRPDAVRRRVGVVGHRTLLYDDLTCRENLVYYGRLFGLDHVQQRVEEVLCRVGLDRRADERVRTLSNGMQKRASIARAILHQPPLLLLDEPEAGLDRDSLAMLKDLLADWVQAGRTVIMTTHNVELGLSWGDPEHIGVLLQGRIHFQEPSNYLNEAEFRQALTATLEARR